MWEMGKIGLSEILNSHNYVAPELDVKIKERIFSCTSRKKVSLFSKFKYFVPVWAMLLFWVFVLHSLDYLNIWKPVTITIMTDDNWMASDDLISENKLSFVLDDNIEVDSFSKAWDENLLIENINNKPNVIDESIEKNVTSVVVDWSKQIENIDKALKDVIIAETIDDDQKENIDQTQLLEMINNTLDVDSNEGLSDDFVDSIVEEKDVDEMFTEKISNSLDSTNQSAVRKSTIDALPDLKLTYFLIEIDDKKIRFEWELTNWWSFFDSKSSVGLVCMHKKSGKIVLEEWNYIFNVQNMLSKSSQLFDISFETPLERLDLIMLEKYPDEIICEIDSNNLIDESNEDNNTVLLKVGIKKI